MANADAKILDLNTFWPYQVAVLADKISRHTLNLAKTHGKLNLSQWRVLAAVADKPGRTSAEVVAVTPMDKGVVSRAVASLIDVGLVKKIPHPDDKRRATLELTDKGEAIYRLIALKLDAALSDIGADAANAGQFCDLVKNYTRQMPTV